MIQNVTDSMQQVCGPARYTIAYETGRQARVYEPHERREPRLPFALLAKSAKAPEPVYTGLLIDLIDDQLYWEIDWLLENLCDYVDKTEIPAVMKSAWTKLCDPPATAPIGNVR